MPKPKLIPKRKGVGLEVKTFTGKSGYTYVVFKTAALTFHVFTEVEAFQAALDCGAEGKGTKIWQNIWDKPN
jgi:hypothetical protein